MVINGYKIPGGKAGLAIRIAADMIMKRPGIKQGELLNLACEKASLHTSTATWITSPSDKSPAEKFWTRRKEGRSFCLYPNEWTQTVAESFRDAYRDYVNTSIASHKKEFVKWFGREIRVSDLFQLNNLETYESGRRGVVMGFKIDQHSSYTTQSASGFSNSVDEAISEWNKRFDSDPDFVCNSQTLITLFLNDNGELSYYHGGYWIGRLMNDLPPVWKIQIKKSFTNRGYPCDVGQVAVKSGQGFYFNPPSMNERAETSSWKKKKDADNFLVKVAQEMGQPLDTFEVVLF